VDEQLINSILCVVAIKSPGQGNNDMYST